MSMPAGISRRALLHSALAALTVFGAGLSANPAHSDQKETKERILFVSNREKPTDFAIYSMNADGSDQTRISKGEGVNIDPSWSPDHSQILFTHLADKEARKTEICLMKPDGSGIKVIVPGEAQTAFISPVWSPDGKHIAYSALQIGAGFVSTVYVVDADGKNRKKVVDGAVAVWSPDSKRLMYSSIPKEDIPELKIVDLDGANGKTLAPQGFSPAWSPDGKKIVYTGNSDNRPALFVMDADGAHSTLLTKDPDTLAMGPTWTQDGKHILFTRLPKSDEGGPKPEVWIMDADGANAKALTKADSFIGAGVSLVFVMRSEGK